MCSNAMLREMIYGPECTDIKLKLSFYLFFHRTLYFALFLLIHLNVLVLSETFSQTPFARNSIDNPPKLLFFFF